MSEVKVVKRWPRYNRTTSPVQTREIDALPASAFPPKIVAIGASTGGPPVLQTILSALPRGFPLPVLVVQHMSPGFAQGFVEWLSQASGFPMRVATQGEPLSPGQAYMAPDDFHMGVDSLGRIRLSSDPRENGLRPSASFLFRSVNLAFGPNAIGIILTGMGTDGAEELKRMRDAGALTIAQDAESSVVHGMPGQAISLGAAKLVLPPAGIAKALTALVTKP